MASKQEKLIEKALLISKIKFGSEKQFADALVRLGDEIVKQKGCGSGGSSLRDS